MRPLVIDIRRLFAGLIEAVGRADFPDTEILAARINLDIGNASVAKTQSNLLLIHHAHLDGGATEVSVACGIKPRREIWQICEEPSIPYRDLKDETFGANQRTEPSKRSAGVGVLFEIDGWTCGYTAWSPDGDVDAFFCEEPMIKATNNGLIEPWGDLRDL